MLFFFSYYSSYMFFSRKIRNVCDSVSIFESIYNSHIKIVVSDWIAYCSKLLIVGWRQRYKNLSFKILVIQVLQNQNQNQTQTRTNNKLNLTKYRLGPITS